ncbi:MAG: hypothetical protein AB7F86_18450, partial [Bdellovibrionales bacterium]
TVQLYVDSSCTTMVGSGTAAGISIDISSSALSVGVHTLYANRDNASASASPCSTAFLSYEVISSPPAVPTSLTLQNPTTSPNNDATPTIRVGTVAAGYVAHLYSDASCTTEVGSATATGTLVDVTVAALADGTYTFYAKSENAGGTFSSCSTANVTYQYDSGLSILPAPTLITLLNPTTSPDQDTTPQLQVSGVASGDTVKLFTDSACSTQVASGTASGTTINLTTSVLSVGVYKIYANRTDTSPSTSNCSSVYANYEVTNIIQIDTFQSGFGNWANVTGDDQDWTRNSGTTPSTGVGPDAGYGNTGFYLYTEASSPVAANDVFNLESNTLDAGANNLAVNFKWNKRGTSMGNTYLEVSTDGGTNWDTAVWSHVGSDVATSGTHTWRSTTVDLCGLGYNSGNIKLRFRGVMPSTGTVWNSDMAIDNVMVYASSCAAPVTVAITSPAADTLITELTKSSFAVSGTCSNNGGTVEISGDASASTTCSGGTWSANLNFTDAPDGPVVIQARHIFGEMEGSDNRAFTKDATIIYSDDFEVDFGNWANVTGDDQDWTRNTGNTPSNGVGPSTDASGSGYYLYTEASNPTSANDVFNLVGPSVNAGTYQLKLDFKYNKRGTTMGNLYVEVSTDGGTNWDTAIWSHLGADVNSNGIDIWRDGTVDLCGQGYTTGNVKIRFRAVMPSTGTIRNSDMGIDEVKISKGPCL